MSGTSASAGLATIHSQLTFCVPAASASFTGQTAIVTGANAGLGRETATYLVAQGAGKVILAVRTVSKGEDAREYIEKKTGRKGVVEVWELDMANFASVRAFARRAQGLGRMDAVVLNAGVWPTSFRTAEGFEETITINVIATFLLTQLLMPKLATTAASTGTTPRLTIVGSTLHRQAALSARHAPKIFTGLNAPLTPADYDGRYNDSKLLLLLYLQKLTPTLPEGVCVNVVCPGWCHSGLKNGSGTAEVVAKKLLARSTDEGARIIVDAVDVAKVEGRKGAFLSDMRVKKPAPWIATKEGKATTGRVWEELNEILKDQMTGA